MMCNLYDLICLFEMKLCLLGPCYCRDKQGQPERNEIMCITKTNFVPLDLCNDNEWCVGPKSPDRAQIFSKTDFCSEGELEA